MQMDVSFNLTFSLKRNLIYNNKIPLFFRNGYYFDTAMLLSVFLGMFGIDRFYLGYPAIGLLKFCTLGFMFVGQLVDIILIATQVCIDRKKDSSIINHLT